MSIIETLTDRAGAQCELCRSTMQLDVYEVPPVDGANSDKCILACKQCREQLDNTCDLTPEHWRCLNDSMWSSVAAVQVTAWRLLKRLSAERWAQDLFDMLYLDETLLTWAEQSGETENEQATHDSNGAILQAGDTVTLIKDLNVKGGGFTAKRGTIVKNISLTDNPEHIEGRVNGVRIVLVSQYLKKSS